jgi:NADH-quinone oxidoreductase E subunit
MCNTPGESMLDKDIRNSIEALMKKLPCIDSAILPSLSLIQKQNGYISEGDMEELSRILKFPEARIFSVASFYSMLNVRPRGKYHLQICTNVSCSIVEKETLFDYISEKLDIKDSETTPDGLFSIESVECLGSCGYARAMIVNSDHYENLNFEKVDEILNEIEKRERSNK